MLASETSQEFASAETAQAGESHQKFGSVVVVIVVEVVVVSSFSVVGFQVVVVRQLAADFRFRADPFLKPVVAQGAPVVAAYVES